MKIRATFVTYNRRKIPFEIEASNEYEFSESLYRKTSPRVGSEIGKNNWVEGGYIKFDNGMETCAHDINLVGRGLRSREIENIAKAYFEKTVTPVFPGQNQGKGASA